jgi:hypothetical protein
MITLVTTTIPEVERYFEHFKKSIIEHSKLITEVVICKADQHYTYSNTWIENGIAFREIGSPFSEYRKFNKLDVSQDHLHALHQSIDCSSNDLILISDVDVFFYTNVDKLYYDLMLKFNLDMIGVSRNNPNWYVHGYFPTVVNMMVRKSKLPTQKFAQQFGVNHFLGFKLEWRDSPPENFKELFLKPNGHYDTGCLLYPWAIQNNMNWLSFQTIDLHNYSTKYHASSPKIKNLPITKLLYHQSVSVSDTAFAEYKTALESK